MPQADECAVFPFGVLVLNSSDDRAHKHDTGNRSVDSIVAVALILDNEVGT